MSFATYDMGKADVLETVAWETLDVRGDYLKIDLYMQNLK
jgi:hypothetical protein